jgi:hypothetical protein
MEKFSNNKFRENPFVEAELFYADRRAGGRTDRHDEVYTSFSQFCERA